MNDLRRAQIEVRKIDSLFPKFKQTKWSDVYKDEDELLNDLMNIHIPTKDEFSYSVSQLYNGYDYIHSFARIIQNGSNLSEAQLRQVKRLAVEIKKAATIAKYF